MRIRPAVTGEGWALDVGERRVGYIRGSAVGFVGFASDEEAALAARMAYRVLTRRRSDATRPASEEEPRFGLLPPDSPDTRGSWGFEITLRPEESVDVFAMARARIMWNAIRASGLATAMRQFAPAPSASAAG